MPTEVFDLSPDQLDWLYEHQALKNVDALHHLDILANDATPNLSPKCQRPTQVLDMRRHSMGGLENCTASSNTSHTTLTTFGSQTRGSPELVTEAIMFPFTCERPTWEQSLANLLSYKEHHGVSWQCGSFFHAA